MKKKAHQIRVHELAHLMVYILGRRPHEFGLVPDPEGYVSYKELLQCIREESRWAHVDRGLIREVLMGEERHLFEAGERRIRTLERQWDLNFHSPAELPPKLLFTPVRQRAHPVVMERGLQGGETKPLVLSSAKEMASRIGKRRTPEPALLEILASKAQEQGIPFYPFGDLFLALEVPARFIAGPPVSKELMERQTERKKAKVKPPVEPMPPTPGSFPLDVRRDPDRSRKGKGKKPKGWKEEARKIRKEKRR